MLKKNTTKDVFQQIHDQNDDFCWKTDIFEKNHSTFGEAHVKVSQYGCRFPTFCNFKLGILEEFFSNFKFNHDNVAADFSRTF